VILLILGRIFAPNKNSQAMIRVLLFEDIKEIREMLSDTIRSAEDMYLLGAFADANDVLKIIKKHKPDVVLMDIQMPGMSGIEAVRLIKSNQPAVEILIQTVFEDNEKIFAAICAGASGYILKDTTPERYLEAIIETYQGGAHMSPRIARKMVAMFQNTQKKPKEYTELTATERKVLDCLAQGMSYKIIADTCGVSFSTVNFHLKNIYRKLHVNSATEAILHAINRQLL
jgi:DNA-binding NarL/FixJ family response regulator